MPATDIRSSPAALMIQGTGSDVGKSLVVAGLCRAYHRRGLRVAPFKPQNMSNNAAVTPDGGEIGRAQALQALAAKIPPSVHMNPVLLKPQSETGAQVVVQGRVFGTASAREYATLKTSLLDRVLDSFDRIGRNADLVLVEGAGSPAEVNLRANDIANMGFAVAARVPVLLVGDVDRGGVIAALVGTHALLDQAERDLVKAWCVNKFRGDPRLFDEAIPVIEGRTGWRCAGVIPYFDDARRLPGEDSLSLKTDAVSDRDILIAVPRLRRIANFDDLDPLAAEPDVRVIFVEPGQVIPAEADVIVIPGSKSTCADLRDLREQGWDLDLRAHLRRGGTIVGLCGGYQMLGRVVHDFDGIEGRSGSVEGLGFLDLETTLKTEKTLCAVHGTELASGAAISGYEMHMGITEGPDRAHEWLDLETEGCLPRPEGAVSADGRVMGSYVHGLFASDGFRRAFLARLRPGRNSDLAYGPMVEATLDRLADHLEVTLDLDLLLESARS